MLSYMRCLLLFCSLVWSSRLPSKPIHLDALSRRRKYAQYLLSMGTFSVRNLRADKQNVSMKHGRACPSLVRFLACYLCTCAAFYLYFRYYLMNERDYGTPAPAAVIHDNVFRPFDAFSSSKAVISPNELFEKLQSKYMAPKRPGVLGRINGYAWHKSEEGIVTKLEDSSEKSIKLQSPSVVTEESLDKTSTSSGRPDISSVRDNSDDSNKTEDSVQLAGNSTRDQANTSNIIPQINSRNFDLKLVQVISQPKTVQRSSIAHRFQDFRRQWLRQRRARVDWQSIIKPCNDNMAWGQVPDGWSKLNRSSPVASDVVFWPEPGRRSL